MPDYVALARAAGCEAAVLEWLAANEEIAAGLPDLRAADWPRRRRAARELADVLATRFTLPGPAGCVVTEHRVPVRSGEVTVLRYHPPGDDRPRPAHLSVHGGGFIGGDVHEVINDRLLRRRAVDSGFDIFDIDYRLAPEHPFPAGLEDCVDVLGWLAASAAELGIDAGRLGVGGASAGGNLAALAAVHLRDAGGPPLDHQVLEVPAASLYLDRDGSFREHGVLADFGDFAEIRAAYLGADPAPGPAAPAEVRDLAGLPPALVLTAECDPLRDCGEAYAARLAAAGVPVETWRAPRQVHGSAGITATSPIAREWQDRVSGFLRARRTAATVH
ncbi:alpha/beta hydrolase [Amycolatopsis samaneae]|uniref:Alpha/beta hydrolase n=1 Tax=Amycolatopsis samaneae TaxID=664691 RepID=A0ABW5GSU0_9PSEU